MEVEFNSGFSRRFRVAKSNYKWPKKQTEEEQCKLKCRRRIEELEEEKRIREQFEL